MYLYFLDEDPATTSPSTNPNTAVIASASVTVVVVIALSIAGIISTIVIIIKYKVMNNCPVLIFFTCLLFFNNYTYREKGRESSLRLTSKEEQPR